MHIRNSAKAIVLRGESILLNRCETSSGEICYDLPGGGQHLFESMEEAVVREVWEETGYQVRVLRFLALAEEIEENPQIREKFPDYSHRMMHLFLAEWTGENPSLPTEADYQMVDSQWIPLSQADSLPIRPDILSGQLNALIRGEISPFLGTARVYSRL